MKIITMSKPKKKRTANGEKEWEKEFDSNVEETTLSFSMDKISGSTLYLRGLGKPQKAVGFNRVIFSLSDDGKLYVIPSEDGSWLFDKQNGWSTTVTNEEFAKSIRKYMGGLYKLHKEPWKILDTPSNLFYFDLNKNIRKQGQPKASTTSNKGENVQEGIPFDGLLWEAINKINKRLDDMEAEK